MHTHIYIHIHIYFHACTCPQTAELKANWLSNYHIGIQHIAVTLFEWRYFCVVGGCTANRNSIYPDYDNEMIN